MMKSDEQLAEEAISGAVTYKSLALSIAETIRRVRLDARKSERERCAMACDHAGFKGMAATFRREESAN
jgi:hypothetical protein